MNREILTYPLSKEQFWAEFRYFVAYFRNMGARDCTVLFGFAWGIEYYPEKEWIPETILLDELEERILELERRGLGEFGFNDVFVELADVEFRFCNDTDIHIGFNRQQPLIEDFYSRWQALGYCPAEWLKNEDHGPLAHSALDPKSGAFWAVYGNVMGGGFLASKQLEVEVFVALPLSPLLSGKSANINKVFSGGRYRRISELRYPAQQ